jgi:hypothetical protein
VAGGKNGFSKVASDNFFRLTNGSEIDAGVPMQQ